MKRTSPLGPALLPLLLFTSCGGGGNGPTEPSPPPTPTYSLTATVYYDENGNGQLDGSELVRIPGVDVVVGNASARTATRTGQAAVSGIAEGSAVVTLRTDSLPWYYTAPGGVPVQIPGTAEVRLPVRLSIGNNNPNIYLGYGDSLTRGQGSSGDGYRAGLTARLSTHLGFADVRLWGRDGDESWEAAEGDVTRRTLRRDNPAYVLLLFGTNDWHPCQDRTPAQCFTIESLRTVIGQIRDLGSLPVLGTIPPGNPNLVPAGRNSWYDQMNALLRALAIEQNVPLADLNAEFRSGTGEVQASLFYDDVHPNNAGYEALALGWFKALTRARSAAASASGGRVGFRPPWER